MLKDGEIVIRYILEKESTFRLIDDSPLRLINRDDINQAQWLGQSFTHIYLDNTKGKKERVNDLEKVGITASNYSTACKNFMYTGLKAIPPVFLGWDFSRQESQSQLPLICLAIEGQSEDASNTSYSSSGYDFSRDILPGSFAPQMREIVRGIREEGKIISPVLQLFTHKEYKDYKGLQNFFLPLLYVKNELAVILKKVKNKSLGYTQLDLERDLKDATIWAEASQERTPKLYPEDYDRWSKLQVHHNYFLIFVVTVMQDALKRKGGYQWEEVRKDINQELDNEIRSIAQGNTPLPNISINWAIGAIKQLKELLEHTKEWKKIDLQRFKNHKEHNAIAAKYANDRMPTGFSDVIDSLRFTTAIVIKLDKSVISEPITFLTESTRS